MQIPYHIGKIRVIRLAGGSYGITRKNHMAESWLDKHLIRMPNQQQWIMRREDDPPWHDFRDQVRGSTVYILGKGKSLDDLRAEHIDAGPIICLNEAIYKANDLDLPNQLYVMAWDGHPQDTHTPDGTIVLCPRLARHCFEGREDVLYFYPEDYKLPSGNYTSVYALALCEFFKAHKIIMFGFDYYTDKKPYYATLPGVGERTHKVTRQDIKRLQVQQPHLTNQLKRMSMDVVFTTQIDHPILVVPDIPEPSQDNHLKPDEPDHEESLIEMQDT